MVQEIHREFLPVCLIASLLVIQYTRQVVTTVRFYSTEKIVSDFNTGIVEEFRANQGKVGGMFEGANLFLLHNTGRRSGKINVVQLVYFKDGDRIVIAASKGGAPENPAWYHNLIANPATTVEIGTETRSVTASEITGEDRYRIWQDIAAAAPGFGEYQTKTTRIIPLFDLNLQ